MTGVSRRELLTRVSAAAGASGVAVLAGCAGILGEDGRADIDEPGPGSFVDWAPAPSALGDDDPDVYRLGATQPKSLQAHRDTVPADLSTLDGEQFEGIRVSDLDVLYSLPRGFVYQGEYERETVREFLLEEGARERGTDGEFAIYARSGLAVALDDETAVYDFDVENLTTRLAAKRGDVPRVTDDIEDLRALFELLGDGTWVRAWRDEGLETFEGAVAMGERLDVAAEETDYRAVVVYEASSEVDSAHLRERLGRLSQFGSPDALDLGVQGRRAVVTATLPTTDLAYLNALHRFAYPTAYMPETTITFDLEPTGDDVGLLEVKHADGDAINSEDLHIRGDGFADVSGADMTGPGPWAGDTEDGSVVAGSSVTVGVRLDYEVSVVWEWQHEDVSRTLATHQGPTR